jgi:hypothetical protein
MKPITALVASVLLASNAFAAPPAVHPTPPTANSEAKADAVPPVAAEASKGEEVINASEVDALRAEVRTLKAENADLRKRLDELTEARVNKSKPGAVANAKAPRRNFSHIEIGMTREEVDQYLRSQKDLKLIGISADAGVSRQSEEVVVRRDGQTNTTTLRRGGPAHVPPSGPGTIDETQQAVNADHREIIDRKINSGRREVMTIAAMGTERVVTGQKRTALGGSSPVYGTRLRENGRIRVTLVDHIVTGIDGMQY